MPFEKGNKLAKLAENPGRKVYEIEQEQVKEMQANFNWLLGYVKAVRKGKNTTKQDKIFDRLERILLKFLDKLHANKQQTEITGEVGLPFTIKIIRDDGSTNTREGS